MLIQIERKFTFKGFVLSSKTHPELLGKMNLTFGILRRVLTVQNTKTKTEYALKQLSRFQKFLSIFPLGNIYPRPYYHFFANGYKHGRTKSTRFFTQTLLFDFGDEYEVFRHGDNYISILKNGEQVALLHRDRREDNGRASYDGHYQDKAIDPAMIMLWIEYSDVSFFPMRGLHSTVIREYKSFKREPFQDRVKWIPKE